MKVYPSTPTALFSPEVEDSRSKVVYSPLTPLVQSFTWALVFVGLVTLLRFLWPGLGLGAIQVIATAVCFAWILLARKVGVIQPFRRADADKLPRGWYFLSCFITFSVLWVAALVFPAGQDRTNPAFLIGAIPLGILMGGFSAAATAGLSWHRF